MQGCISELKDRNGKWPRTDLRTNLLSYSYNQLSCLKIANHNEQNNPVGYRVWRIERRCRLLALLSHVHICGILFALNSRLDIIRSYDFLFLEGGRFNKNHKSIQSRMCVVHIKMLRSSIFPRVVFISAWLEIQARNAFYMHRYKLLYWFSSRLSGFLKFRHQETKKFPTLLRTLVPFFNSTIYIKNFCLCVCNWKTDSNRRIGRLRNEEAMHLTKTF